MPTQSCAKVEIIGFENYHQCVLCTVTLLSHFRKIYSNGFGFEFCQPDQDIEQVLTQSLTVCRHLYCHDPLSRPPATQSTRNFENQLHTFSRLR